jgi:hypothetical protein
VTRLVAAALALGLAAAAHAQTSALGNVDVVSDTDGFHATRVRAEGAITEHTRLAFHALCSRTTAYVDAPDYSSRQARITLVHRF